MGNSLRMFSKLRLMAGLVVLLAYARRRYRRHLFLTSLNPFVNTNSDHQNLLGGVEDVLVETTKGVIRGFYEKDHKVFNFRGVPFAAPPVGELRFKRPIDNPGWEGVKDCRLFGKWSVQDPDLTVESLISPRFTIIQLILKKLILGYGLNLDPFDAAPMSPKQDEDCLTLNICTPDMNGRHPVAVWIHGGGFMLGSGSEGLYSQRWGNPLAKEGVVLVTINYRLGALGFLKVQDGDFNCGIWDQVKALEWVQNEISRFGGDPTNVTVFGESAGGMSVGSLISSPIATKYFRRAILQSGGCQAVSQKVAQNISEAVSRSFQIDDPIEMTAKRLSRFNGASIFAAQRRAQVFGRLGLMPFQPVIDGELLPDSPIESVRNGSANGIDIAVGFNKDEWNIFTKLVSPIPWMPRFLVKQIFHFAVSVVSILIFKFDCWVQGGHTLADDHDDAHSVTHELMQRYGDEHERDHGVIDWFKVNNQMMTDLVFAVPAKILAEEHSACKHDGVKTFMYRFDFENQLGAVSVT